MGDASVDTSIVASALKDVMSSVESDCLAPAVPWCPGSLHAREEKLSGRNMGENVY